MTVITFLVEDNPTIREHPVPTLEDLTGAKVIGIAETEGAAVHWLNSHDGQWDLAFVDLFLKEGSGLGVLTGCRDPEVHQRIVVLTNYATPETCKRALEFVADA